MAPDERVPDTGIFLPTVASEDCSIRDAGRFATDGESNVCSAEPLYSSPPKSSENHVALVTRSEHRSALVPSTTRKPRMQVLKEKLKDRLKEKLKPKLRLSYFKHRQGSNSQVATLNGDADEIASLKMLPAGVKMEPEDDAPSSFLSLGTEPTGQLVVANGRKKAGNKVSSPMSRVSRFADSILDFVGERSVPEKLIRGALGNNPDISKAIRLLLSEKKLKRLGDGGKGCAYVYVRTDQAEAKSNARELSPVEMNTQALIEREFVRELERRFPATNIIDWNVLNGCERMQGDQLQCDV